MFSSTAEMMILTVGFYYGNSARNARVLFDERRFLFYAITVELTVSSLYNGVRTAYPVPFHQDVMFAAAFLRGLLTNTLALFIIFLPKVRSRTLSHVISTAHLCHYTPAVVFSLSEP